jgi:hypothetical protein
MLIFRRIFLSHYWWQKSYIWSQASYRYPISWEAFLDPSDSYFLFADFEEVGIWRVQKRYPQYGISIWRLWPNIRFLPSTVTEKNVTKNFFDGQTDRGKTVYPPPTSAFIIYTHSLTILFSKTLNCSQNFAQTKESHQYMNKQTKILCLVENICKGGSTFLYPRSPGIYKMYVQCV